MKLKSSGPLEVAYLGMILQQMMASPDLDKQAELLAQVGADVFEAEHHRLIFEAMLAIHAAGGVVDTIGIDARLNQVGADGKTAAAAIAQAVRKSCLEYLEGLDVSVAGYFDPTCHGYAQGLKDFRDIRASNQVAAELHQEILRDGIEAAIAAAGSKLRAIAQGRSSMSKWEDVGDIYTRRNEQHRTRREDGQSYGMLTQIRALDDITCGFFPGQYSIIAGTPGAGKTALATQIARHLAENGRRILFLSLEMSKEAIIDRMACSKVGLPLSALLMSQLSDRHMELLENDREVVGRLPIKINGDTDCIETIVADVLGMMAGDWCPDMLIIDHCKKLTTNGKPGNREDLRSTFISNQIQNLVNVKIRGRVAPHVMVLSHLSKEHLGKTGNGIPQVHQLRDNFGWAEAHVAILLHRPWSLTHDREASYLEKGKVIARIGKNRNGPEEDVEVFFDGYAQRYSDMPTDGGG